VRLRALLLDAGNTLIRMDYHAMARRLAAAGVVTTARAVQRAEWRARVRLDDEVLSDARPGTSTESRSTGERYARYLLEGLGVGDAATVEAFVQWRRRYNPPLGLWTAVEPRAARALARARAAGLRTAVISNSNGTVRTILERLGLTRDLDFVIDSGEVGVEKPDPAIFRLALERAGVAPAEAVYVGDLYSVDVLGARAAGIQAILVDPGRCWGARDCRRAGDVDAAVRLALAGGGATREASRTGSARARRR
jgi:putative hydrolase of the HAD superfamily